jgi:ribonuclease HI
MGNGVEHVVDFEKRNAIKS